MYRYILWKFWTTLLTFVLSVMLFYLLYVSFKGNPFAGDPNYSDPKDYQNAITTFGINDPIMVRFGHYISNLFKGDFGPFFKFTTSYKTIPEAFFKPLRTSMLVTIPSYFIGMFFGLFLGYWAGYKRGKLPDIIINGFVTIFIAIPSFVFAIFMLILSPILGLPVIFKDSASPNNSVGDMIQTVIAPTITISLLSLAGWTYILRNEVASILASEFILSARTKGLGEKTIFFRYVLRNSMYPYIGSIVTSFMIVFSSSIIIERFFNVKGISTMLLAASQTGEINIMMFNLIFFSSIALFSQILVDIAQFTINPIVKSNFNSKTSFVTKLFAEIERNKQRKQIINNLNISQEEGDE